MRLSLWLFFLALLARAPGQVSITVDNSFVHPLSPLLWSSFFEEINFAGEGGLYAELIRNRDFEALGRGNLGTQRSVDYTPPVPNYGDYRPWTGAGFGGLDGSMALDNATNPFPSNPMTLRIDVKNGKCEGCSFVLSNPGYWGIGVYPSDTFKLKFYAKVSQSSSMIMAASIVSSSQEVALSGGIIVAGDWKLYSLTLAATTAATVSNGVFQLAITVPNGTATLWLDSVSLFPSSAVKGLYRKDLFNALNDIRPGVLRFPGGNYLEGNDLASHWDWKKTINDSAARPGHYNSAWGYWNNDGLGFHEYLQLCEALQTVPLMAIFTGYCMGQKYIPLNESQGFIQDALDALEYANDRRPMSDTGKMRIANGHPEPFNLDRLEIGNEERDMEEYRSHYEAFTKAIWEQHPDVTVIASGRWGPSIDGNPCLSGDRCDLWDDHYYRTPDDMAALDTAYDDYDRKWPKVFVGEYAANSKNDGTLRAGLAEAAFMIGFEHNADVVLQSSFAPLFRHVEGAQWGYDMINFNSTHVYVLPSYHVQKMYQDVLGKNTLKTTFQGLKQASASVDSDGLVSVKAVNYGPDKLHVSINLTGFTVVDGDGTMAQLTADDPDAVNSLDDPNRVSPALYDLQDIGSSFTLDLPAWSLSIISVHTS